jgi:hypothetical protein
MRFASEHRFHGSPAAVAAILADPGFYVGLKLPDLSQPDVLDQHTEGDTDVLRLRYLFLGSLHPVARRLLGKRQLAWIQEVRVNGVTGSGEITFQAEAEPKRLHGSANFTLEPVTLQPEGTGTIQRLTGDVVVAVPVVGGRAEKQIVAGLQRRLDIEAASLDERLSA